MKPQRDGQKKRKQTLTEGDEPESKMNKTEAAEAEMAKGTVVTINSKHHILDGQGPFCLSVHDGGWFSCVPLDTIEIKPDAEPGEEKTSLTVCEFCLALTFVCCKKKKTFCLQLFNSARFLTGDEASRRWGARYTWFHFDFQAS